LIELRNITKRFGDYPALHGVDLAIAPGEFIALLGPSGSGKTTLLRIIAGLEFQDGGAVLFDGEDVSARPVAERGVGFVFQHYALFRHMSVTANVAFGLTVRRRKSGLSARDRRARADELLRLVQLDGMGDRYPAQLSGGQRQRVALARALAVEPKLLLLDEPFGALDARVRKDLRRALRDLHRRMGLTSVFVTHDQEEALELADRVVVMNQGRIEQIGPPNELYHNPKTRFVAGFIGSPAMNFLPARVVNGGSNLSIRLSDKLSLPVPAERTARYKPYLDKEVVFGLRPEDLIESRGDVPAGSASFDVQLDVVEPMGMETMVYFIVDGVEVCGRVNPAAARGAGESMTLVADLNHMHLIDPATDQVI
jgi:sulfate ABC transporter ATP-binding protein